MISPFLGVFFHWLGGLASGSFYVPYKGVKKWSWETYWLVGGFFSWIICPLLLASVLTNDVLGVLRQQSGTTLWWTYFFGAMWGFGGLTFGLTMRYLGMSLGMGVALGYCAAFGTLLPPIFKVFIPSIPVPETIVQIAATRPGQVTLLGVFVCLLGIAVAALAGFKKESEMPETEKKKAIAEFNFRKGLLVATFSGVMSACFAFALTAGNPIGEASRAAGTDAIWTGLPKLIVVLLGGFTTNFIWCVILNVRNRTAYQYTASHIRQEHVVGKTADGGHPDAVGARPAKVNLASADLKVPVLGNYLFSALAGTLWYFQFFFYTMGETQMGEFGFASWTLHMASIIIFSTMWGWIFHEWKGSSKKVHGFIATGIALLILSTVIIGLGTWLRGYECGHAADPPGLVPGVACAPARSQPAGLLGRKVARRGAAGGSRCSPPTAPGARARLSAGLARLVCRIYPDFGDEGSEEGRAFRQTGGFADANLGSLALADGEVDCAQVPAAHADLVGGEADFANGFVVGQFSTKQERIRERQALTVGVQPEANRRDLLRVEATRGAGTGQLFAGKLGLESTHRRIRMPWPGVSE